MQFTVKKDGLVVVTRPGSQALWIEYTDKKMFFSVVYLKKIGLNNLIMALCGNINI